MRVIILGSGGREHALAYKMALSDCVSTIYALPGNPGMAFTPKVQLLAVDPCDIDRVARMAKDLKADLVIVGPEKPLAQGIVDELQKAGIVALGPTQKAAQLESSKIYAKEFMAEFEIPTARFVKCADYQEALATLTAWDYSDGKGVVLKADELCQGKGVIVAADCLEAMLGLENLMGKGDYPVKAKKIILEEKICGKEVSAFALCDGQNFITLGYACDYKRAYDWDQGPNTGGMGATIPQNWPTADQRAWIEKNIFAKTMTGCQKRGIPFKGFLFAGLMIDGDGVGENIQLLEYNTRLGDPETQVLLPSIEDDLFPYFLAAAKGELNQFQESPKIKKEAAIHVVMASGGYPGNNLALGKLIEYSTDIPQEDLLIFFSGVQKDQYGLIKNSGGRVMGITALAPTLTEARAKVYAAIGKVHLEKSFCRSDIGLNA
ncbi:MAG: phosphoribosylamine--glycine ligase [Pseudomonadota bacterium]